MGTHGRKHSAHSHCQVKLTHDSTFSESSARRSRQMIYTAVVYAAVFFGKNERYHARRVRMYSGLSGYFL